MPPKPIESRIVAKVQFENIEFSLNGLGTVA
jgi:hypothetical protein